MGVCDALKARGAGMDPVSAMACSWAAAGIPKKGTEGMLPVKNCRGTQVPSGPPVDRLRGPLGTSLQKLGTFTPALPLLHGSVLKHCPGEPIAGQQLWLHGMSWL